MSGFWFLKKLQKNCLTPANLIATLYILSEIDVAWKSYAFYYLKNPSDKIGENISK